MINEMDDSHVNTNIEPDGERVSQGLCAIEQACFANQVDLLHEFFVCDPFRCTPSIWQAPLFLQSIQP
jgi:hypothetical protein